MKNQPNKATVKDGLPTAERIIREKIKEHSASTVNIDVDNIPEFTHFLFVAIDAMQSYSDQQNAELREKLSRLGAMHEDIVVENAKIREGFRQKDERIAVMEERVKELEAGNNRILNEVNEINKLTKQTRANVTMRIIELETKNDRLCEALKKIADRFDPETQDFEGIIRIAEEALKQQEK